MERKYLLLALPISLAITGGALVGCEDDGPDVEEMADSVGDAARDGADEAGDAADDAKDAVDDAFD